MPARSVTTQKHVVMFFQGGMCKCCGGSGHLLRPQPEKFLSFKHCSSCGGTGKKWKPPPEAERGET